MVDLKPLGPHKILCDYRDEGIKTYDCTVNRVSTCPDSRSAANNPYIRSPKGMGLFTDFPSAMIVVGDAQRLEREVAALERALEYDGNPRADGGCNQVKAESDRMHCGDYTQYGGVDKEGLHMMLQRCDITASLHRSTVRSCLCLVRSWTQGPVNSVTHRTYLAQTYDDPRRIHPLTHV